MGFTYFKDEFNKNKNWSEITREERFFTCQLYLHIYNNVKKFIEFINTKNPKYKLNNNMEWEIAFEVCFYRDFLNFIGKPIKETSYSQKRTFDFCLFSEKQIVIIEVKAQQPFEKKQLNNVQNDKIEIGKLLNNNIEIYTLGLCSSKYIENLNIYGKSKVLDLFDIVLSWEDISILYNNDKVFLRANEIYKL